MITRGLDPRSVGHGVVAEAMADAQPLLLQHHEDLPPAAVAVPGRGRILFQQFEMVRAVFGHTDVSKLSILVTRSLPSGPNASPPAEEETARGLVLLQTACDKSKQPHNADWNSQKEAQAILERSCTIGVYNPHANQQATGNGPPGQ